MPTAAIKFYFLGGNWPSVVPGDTENNIIVDLVQATGFIVDLAPTLCPADMITPSSSVTLTNTFNVEL